MSQRLSNIDDYDLSVLIIIYINNAIDACKKLSADKKL